MLQLARDRLECLILFFDTCNKWFPILFIRKAKRSAKRKSIINFVHFKALRSYFQFFTTCIIGGPRPRILSGQEQLDCHDRDFLGAHCGGGHLPPGRQQARAQVQALLGAPGPVPDLHAARRDVPTHQPGARTTSRILNPFFKTLFIFIFFKTKDGAQA